MRHWLFHPLIFYPLAILVAVLVIAVSLKPQAWPREPAPAPAQIQNNTLVYAGQSFDAPSPSSNQNMTVTRDFLGRAQTLRVAILPDQPTPTPQEHGVRILVTPADAARINDRPVTVEVTYNALPFNASSSLAVNLQGARPAEWVMRPTPPDAQLVRFELPAQSSVNAIGLRAYQEGQDEAFGLEITRIRVIPRA